MRQRNRWELYNRVYSPGGRSGRRHTGFSTVSDETSLCSPLMITHNNSALSKTYFSITNKHSMNGLCKHYVIL